MSKDEETGIVRQARIDAKKMARQGELTHQQALDQVARDRGHANWSGLLRSERPQDAGGEDSVRKAGNPRKRSMDVLETEILEQAASRKRFTPWMPIPLSDPLSAGGNVMVFTMMISGFGSFALSAIALGVVACASLAAHQSGTGLIDLRRFVRLWVVPASMMTWIAGGVMMVLALSKYGTATLGGDWPIAMGPAPWATTIYSIGVLGYYASTRSHNAMTLAAPATVKPSRMPDRYVPASGPIASPAVAWTFRFAAYTALGVSILGLVGVIWAMIAMFIQRDLDMHLVTVSVSMVIGGGITAALASLGSDLHKPSKGFVIEDSSRRAARARRFLGKDRSFG